VNHPQAILMQWITGIDHQTIGHCQVVQQADDERDENRYCGDQRNTDALKP
jgi:hypothetical protein